MVPPQEIKVYYVYVCMWSSIQYMYKAEMFDVQYLVTDTILLNGPTLHVQYCQAISTSFIDWLIESIFYLVFGTLHIYIITL